MNLEFSEYNEQDASIAFSTQAPLFDGLYKHNPLIQYKRERVRNHVNQHLQPGSSILELNSGTAEDAIYFAQQGHTVHATDISEGMQRVAKEKISLHQLASRISYDLCAFTDLESLQNTGPYDYIFSNFAGLNCSENIEKVVSSFNLLLNPGGYVTLVIMPGFCLWETLLLFKGKFKTAVRRFSNRGTIAHIEGKYFTCTYYAPSTVSKYMGKSFELVDMEGLCTIVPPSYMEHFNEKHSRLYSWLKKKEEKYKSKWPWKYIGDYYIITFRKL